jgi:hypothetical protein
VGLRTRLQLIYSDHRDESEARLIRHPCAVWFIGRAAPAPSARVGTGKQRHTRPRPGLLVRRVLSVTNKKIYDLDDPALRGTPLGADAAARMEASRRRLEALQAEELAYDREHGLEGVDAAPFRRGEELAADDAARQLTAALAARRAAAAGRGLPPPAAALHRPARVLLLQAGPLAGDAQAAQGAAVKLNWREEVLPRLPAAAVPAPAALAGLLQELAAASQADRHALAHQRCQFVRALGVWLLRLGVVGQGVEGVDGDEAAALLAGTLRALRGLPYSAAADRWLKRVRAWYFVESLAGSGARGAEVHAAAKELHVSRRRRTCCLAHAACCLVAWFHFDGSSSAGVDVDAGSTIRPSEC